jgi:hypothetical protein
MRPKRHPSARTTPAVRRQIQIRGRVETDQKLAREFGLNVKTIAKWRRRKRTTDMPMGPNSSVSSVLLPFEEATIALFRRHTCLSLEETLLRLKHLIPRLTRSTLQRSLKRYGVNKIPAGRRRSLHPFAVEKDTGYIDVKVYAAPRNGEPHFVYFALSDLTKFVFAMEADALDAESAAVFLRDLVAHAPFKILSIETEDHPAFKETSLDPWTYERPWFGHAFRKTCFELAVFPCFRSAVSPKPVGHGWPKTKSKKALVYEAIIADEAMPAATRRWAKSELTLLWKTLPCE